MSRFVSNAYAVGVQSSGEIVVAGYTAAGSAVLAAYNTDGTPDLSFGTNGVVTAPSSVSSASALALQQDDSLVLAGTGSGGPVILRYTAAGILDSTFGSGGSVSLPGGTNSAPVLAIDYSGSESTNPNWGDILVGGNGVVRYVSTGSLDTSFGSGGAAAALTTPFTATAIAVTSGGNVAIAGSLGGAFAAAMYNPDGSLDTDFGIDGQLAFPLNNSFEARATALAVRLDGTLAVAGYAWNGTNNDFAVASILPSDTLALNIPAPTLTATAVSDQEIDLSWPSVYSGATSIHVLQSTDGTTFTPIATLGPSATSYPDTSVSDSSSYTYELLIQGDQCSIDPTQSAYTDPVTASTAAPVTDLAATAASSSEIDLTWSNNDPNSTAFEIDRSTDDENWQAIDTTPDASTLSYHDIGIPEGRPFYYRVKAVLPSGPSDPSFPVVASTPIATTSGPTTYWVAPGGSGTQYTQSSPGYLPTLVNSLDNAPAGGNSIVNLESGNYVLSQTLQIDGNASNVTFEPAPGASTQPVITSGVQITGWSANPVYTVPASGGNPAFDVYSAPLNSADFPIQSQIHFRDFYLNGQRMLVARTPAAGQNYDYIDSITTGTDSSGAPTLTIDIPKADAPDDGSTNFADFVSQQYASDPDNAVEIAFICGYNESQLRIQSATPSGADYALTIAPMDAREFGPSAGYGAETYASQQPFFLENAPQFLSPGEFYENTATKTVYYAVRNSNDVAMLHADEVIVPAAISDGSAPTYPISGSPVISSPLVEIGSDPTTQIPVVPQVQNVTFTKIDFAYSSWVDPSYYGYMADQNGYFTLDSGSGTATDQTPGRDEATIQIAAVRVENTENLNVSDCTFEHLGGAGIEIYDRSMGTVIQGNTFSDIGGDGIIVNGDPLEHGSALAVSASDSISGNTISTIGATFPDSCAVFAVFADNLSITQNDIYDIPETGISVGGGFNQPATSYTLADITRNNIYNFGEVLQDQGGIYMAGQNWKGVAGDGHNTGSVVESNYVHDNPFSQQDGSPTRFVLSNGSDVSLSSSAIYLESTATGVKATSNDTFDIRSGSGARSDQNNRTRLAQSPGPHANELGLPVNNSTVINQAGPTGSNDLNAHLSYHKPQPSVTQSFTLPYTGTYAIAVRVAGVVGAGCAIEVSLSGIPGGFIFNLTPSVAAYSLLLPLAYTDSPSSVSITVTFAGGRSASMILEKMWLVPTLVDPYAN